MLVYLLYMLVFLTKEDQLLSQQVSPNFAVFTSESRHATPPFHTRSSSSSQPSGFTSTQSVGPVHVPALEPTGPVPIPGHYGICQHPLPSLHAAQHRHCASAAAQITAHCCGAPPLPSRSSTQGETQGFFCVNKAFIWHHKHLKEGQS